eukprot:c45395_g1_i1.p1 GENE.c45395_g1_i1~~c45395_g1_i1.p1  ORF type:complete len:455 (+),score=95.62 c45395_g1_i1:107-1366(+)
MKPSNKRKKRSHNETQKPPNTSVVFGPIESEDAFKDFIELVKTEVGGYRSHFYRGHQNCGFIYFTDEEHAQRAIEVFDGYEFKSTTIKACAPRDYFENEEDARPIPANNGRLPNPEPIQVLPEIAQALNINMRRPSHGVLDKAGEPDATLVIKNIPTHLKNDKLKTILQSCDVFPQSVQFKFDDDGDFRGIAFVTFKRVDEAVRALEKIACLEIGKRKLKVSFKRKASSAHNMEHHSSEHSPVVTFNLPVVGPRYSIPNIDFSAVTSGQGDLSADGRELLTELQKFKASPFASELSVPVAEDILERNVVHALAECLNLVHITQYDEETDSTFVIIRKPIPSTGNRRASVDPKRFAPMVNRVRLFSVPNLTAKGPDHDKARGFNANHRKNSLSNESQNRAVPARSERRSILVPGYSVLQS